MKIDLKYQHNLRDLGGIINKNGRKIKYNKLFRSGHLHKLDDNDINILNNLNLTDIIDLRSNIEFVNKADYRLDNVNYHNFPPLTIDGADKNKTSDFNLISTLKNGGGADYMIGLYKQMLLIDSGILAYRNFFKVLSEKNRSVLWHCSQGKDRAGMAAYMLLYALDVSEDVIINDYLLSNDAMIIKVEELESYVKKEVDDFNDDMKKALKEIFWADIRYINAFIESVNNKYGSMDNLLDYLGVDKYLLQELYLE